MPDSGTYTITSDAYQTVATLSSNTANLPVTLVAASGNDKESWVVKKFADGTFTIKNKAFSANATATASLSAGSKVTAGDGTQWKTDGTGIVASGLAWQASGGFVVLQQRDSNNSAQSFTWAAA